MFPFHDAGNLSGGEEGTNVHGLFGALVVEPAGAAWSDPVTGDRLDEPNAGPEGYSCGDGLYMDVHPRGWGELPDTDKTPFDHPPCAKPKAEASFREYVIFFHDEPEYMPAHETLEPPPCPDEMSVGVGHCCSSSCCHSSGGWDEHRGRHLGHHHDHGRGCGSSHSHHRCRQVDHGGRGRGAGHDHGRHGGSEDEGLPPIMPISYRAEPMVNRERKLWRMIRDGTLLKPVIGEEQHHSSWLFGDPATPVLRAYVGDPIRIRLVHAAVKETHVFHQHLYQWHADPNNTQSPILDSITISPQTAHTIEFLYGAGSSQGAIGDAIFHCHLYPHFHEGMWGITRTFDRYQDGCGEYPHDASTPPELVAIEKLMPLPDRQPPPAPTASHPGFPHFIPGQYRQKSPIPPWPFENIPWTPDLDYRPPNLVTAQELNHLNGKPAPGALFNLHPFPDIDTQKRDLAVVLAPVVYNDDGWHDPYGHLFVLAHEAEAAELGGMLRPLVIRGHAESVVETTLQNRLPATIPGTAFDLPIPPCDFFPTPLGECGLHVHLVKFDPLVSDGASVGWNYLSGPRVGKKMIYRWHVDTEFGTVFFHDHLFANYRQKHGLFGAFIAEPKGATFLDPADGVTPIASGLAAVIKPGGATGDLDFTPFREFSFALADFVPLFDGQGDPLNPPAQRGGHSDHGVMAVNYRCEPIIERGGDPAFWFLSYPHQYPVSDPVHVRPRRRGDVHHGDPSTDIFKAHAGDPVRIRLFQGSHEEQHSFQVHGMRWRQYWRDAAREANGPPYDPPVSLWRNQQTVGLSEAFTFALDQRYGVGDHLWKLSAADDLWLGCWGLIRALERGDASLPPLPLSTEEEAAAAAGRTLPALPAPSDMRRFKVIARRRPVVYREPDLIDPFGIIYRLEAHAAPGCDWTAVHPPAGGHPIAGPGEPTDLKDDPDPYAAHGAIEPLILRCRKGEWIQVELVNNLPLGLEPEPFAPKVPVEDCDRPVSSRISMHADLLRYDVRTSDGANVGANPIQTAEPAPFDATGLWPGGTEDDRTVTYHWYADEDVGVVLLQDMADFRNHRHHGAIGALIVEPAGSPSAETTITAWHGARATIENISAGDDGTETREEMVLIMQDGLRLFFHGNPAFPVPDEPADHGASGGPPDPEDQGQKAFNYRCEPVGAPWWLNADDPATPVFSVAPGSKAWFRLVGGLDKPRNQSFTIHGHTWTATHIAEAGRQVGAISGVTSGWAGTLDLMIAPLPQDCTQADYSYRTGVLKYALPQGLWGIIRAGDDSSELVVAQANAEDTETAEPTEASEPPATAETDPME